MWQNVNSNWYLCISFITSRTTKPFQHINNTLICFRVLIPEVTRHLTCRTSDECVKIVKMVSRRKILSRSRDDLNLDDDYKDFSAHFQDDTWYSKEKLYKVRILQNIFIKMVRFMSNINLAGSCWGNIKKMGRHWRRDMGKSYCFKFYLQYTNCVSDPCLAFTNIPATNTLFL